VSWAASATMHPRFYWSWLAEIGLRSLWSFSIAIGSSRSTEDIEGTRLPINQKADVTEQAGHSQPLENT
jgi:hypothetical protein